MGVRTLFIEPGSPWENSRCESFNGKLRDELLDRRIFYRLSEAKVWTERWRWHYNRVRLHGSLGYRPPAPEATAWSPPAAADAAFGGATLGPRLFPLREGAMEESQARNTNIGSGAMSGGRSREKGMQHDQAAQLARPPASGTRGDPAVSTSFRSAKQGGFIETRVALPLTGTWRV